MTTNEDLEEIYLERSRYLLSIDNLSEQILEDQYNIIRVIQTNQEISREISQENDIRIETETPPVFTSNF